MNDADRWIYLDGPEPEHIRPLLDALRDLPPATPEDKERAIRRFLARLDATLPAARITAALAKASQRYPLVVIVTEPQLHPMVSLESSSIGQIARW